MTTMEQIAIPVRIPLGILVTSLASIYTTAHHELTPEDPNIFKPDGMPTDDFANQALGIAAACVERLLQKGLVVR